MYRPVQSSVCKTFSIVVALSFPTFQTTESPLVSITGCVEDSSSAPIRGARVIVENRVTRKLDKTQSDEFGCFKFEQFPSGRTSLSILAEAFEAYETEINLERSTTVPKITLELHPIRNSVTITARRTLAPNATLGTSIDVVDRTELEATKMRNLSDVLRNAAGVTLQESGASGIANFFVRGGESDYNKIFIDGVPVNLPGGGYDLSHIPTDNVDRVEFIRGPQSALFGSDAMSSVVQVLTQRGSIPPTMIYTVEGGSFNKLRQTVALQGSFKNLDFSNSFSSYHTDNLAKNNDYRNNSYFGTYGYTLDPNQNLKVTLMNTSVRAGTPGPTAKRFISFDPTAWMKRRERAMGITYKAFLGSRLTQHLAFRMHDLDQTFVGMFGPFDVVNTRYRGEYRGHLLLSRNSSLSYGLDFDRENGIVTGKPMKRDNVGYYIQHQLEPFHNLHVTLGLRVEDNESFGKVASPKLAFSYGIFQPKGPLEQARIRFSIGTGIKEPSFLENFSNNPFFLGNPNLDPERSRSWEIGWEQGFANDRIVTDITWFANSFFNLIQLAPIGYGQSQFQNIGLTSTHGLELRTKLRMGNFRSKANYTYLKGKIRESSSSSFPFRPGDPLLRRPKHFGNFQLAWLGRSWTATWNSRFVGRRADSDFFTHSPPLISNASYKTSDMAITLQISSYISTFVRIENLFDLQYQEILGFEALRRGITIGTQVRWGRQN